jgi:protocatechuate 3,4-dioxygenase beta subunit
VSLCLCVSLAVFSFILTVVLTQPAAAAAWRCAPTPHDEIGPFYKQNAPLRSKIGSGYILEGTVRSAATCRPVPGARIEFWQAGPDGQYGDAWRAAIITDRRGRYRLTTSVPPPYARRPAHIHILVDMRGYAGLITQHYPRSGQRRAIFDLVMETE